jgi:hypothetical protein
MCNGVNNLVNFVGMVEFSGLSMSWSMRGVGLLGRKSHLISSIQLTYSYPCTAHALCAV